MERDFWCVLSEYRRRAERAITRAGWKMRRAHEDGSITVPNVQWKHVGKFIGASVMLIVACAALVLQVVGGKSGDPLGHVHRLIDVRTGEVYEWNTRDIGAVVLPARHPETGTVALVPINEFEPGKWSISERDLQLLQHLDDGVSVTAVDPATGAVKSTKGGVKTYTRFQHS